MALTITSGYTVSSGEVWTPTKHNLSTTIAIALATSSIMGRATAGPGGVEELSAAQVRTILGLATTDSPAFAGLDSPIGQVTPRSGSFTTLLATYGRFVGGATLVANSLIVDFSTNGRLIATGANSATTGVIDLYVASSNGSSAILPLSLSAAGAAITSANFSDATDASSTTVGSVKLAGGLAVAKGAYFGSQINAPVFNVTSARRFKKNIRTMRDAAALLKLRPVWYDDKGVLGRKKLMGFVAEEVNRVLPSMVGKDTKGRVSALNYSQLVTLAVAALQKHEARLAKLEKEAA